MKVDSLKAIKRGMVWVLGDYDIDLVEEAFKQYISRNNQMPTPADILNIIDPPKEKLSPVLYQQIKKKIADGGFYLTDEEKNFLRKFEKQELDKAK